MNGRIWWVLVTGLCAAFALRSLGLIDATSLWSDELYSVGKSFQPSYRDLLQQLRQDTHPPFYYSLLWLWGCVVGQNGTTLRLLSWVMYLVGGLVMVLQSRALAPAHRSGRAMALAALMAFCSFYPLRFSIEGKSYALLTALVALAWWWRQQQQPLLYGLAVLMASLTHFYGLFLFAAAAIWDAVRHRSCLAWAAALSLIPVLAWIAYARHYLFKASTGGWIGSPDFALFEETLSRALGPWPLPKLLVLLLLLWLVCRWGVDSSEVTAKLSRPGAASGSLLDWSGVSPSALMVLGVVAISFVKPLAFSRYFVVLVPALLPWLAVRAASLPLNRLGRRLGLTALMLWLVMGWYQGFQPLMARGLDASRESDHFSAVSQQTAALAWRFSPRKRLFNLSDRMEQSAGRLPSDLSPWGDGDELEHVLASTPPPPQIVLAASGPDPVMKRRLKPLRQAVESAGYRCGVPSSDVPFTRVLICAKALGN